MKEEEGVEAEAVLVMVVADVEVAGGRAEEFSSEEAPKTKEAGGPIPLRRESLPR